jgi:hypothetical protein
MAKPKTKNAFSDRRAAVQLTILAIVVLLFGLWGWYRFIFSDAENTFWATVDANFKTYGVTRTIEQSQEGSSVNRYIQLQFGDPTAVKDVSVIEQNTEESTTKVTSEVIETQDKSFIRYPKLEATQSGAQRDFSDVLGVWAEDKSENTDAQTLVRDAVIGPLYAVPFAQLSAEQRAELIQYIQDKKIYDVDFEQVKKQSKDGRTVYEYQVKTDVAAYIEMVKKLDAMLGLNKLQDLDTSQYAGQPPVELTMTIDKNARQITEVVYPGNGQTETLSGYGARIIDELPEPQLTREELEAKLQEIVSPSQNQ